MMKRLDVHLAETGLCPSRTQAARAVSKGRVSVNGVIINKPSFMCDTQDNIVLLQAERYVSRGAYKLKGALEVFGTDLKDLVCLDVGASTGGFTQVLLEQDCRRVYAVDVGHAQLAECLLTDSRVVSIEGVNARNLTPQMLPEVCGFAVADLSFISLSLVLYNIARCVSEGSYLMVLVKPQFEAGAAALDKHGVVKNPVFRYKALERVYDSALECGLACKDAYISPISGGDGNIEYFLLLKKAREESMVIAQLRDLAFLACPVK